MTSSPHLDAKPFATEVRVNMGRSLKSPRAEKVSDQPHESLSALAHALRDVSYEVLPFKSTEEKVLAHVPASIPLTVTTTEAKGLEPTIDLTTRLNRAGYDAAPHLAARLVKDRAHLQDLLDRLREANVASIFVIGGDSAEPTGEFADAVGLLRAIRDLGFDFKSVGIAGYPEGHAKIDDQQLKQSLELKAPYASHIITQLCFDTGTTLDWARNTQSLGADLPVRVGIPGAINRQKLIRISASLGLGQSARFLQKQKNMFWRFFMPGGYSPDRLIEGLAPEFAHPGTAPSDTFLGGLHIFTFNELESTEAWRQAWLQRLSNSVQ
jgi:methylenetetrahydrofolate reductase (NADPH)